MKITVAAIAFAVTIGGLFLFENLKTTETRNKSENTENYAQIIRELSSQNLSQTITPKPITKYNKTTTKTPAPSSTPSFITTPSASLFSAPPTPLPTPTPTSIFTPTVTPDSTFIPTPTPQPTQQIDQIIVISLTSPVKQNELAQLDIKTVPQAQCSIKVILPSGSQSSAKGLGDKITDSYGAVTWSWKINWNTTPGTANMDLACSKDGQSFPKSLQMIIVER